MYEPYWRDLVVKFVDCLDHVPGAPERIVIPRYPDMLGSQVPLSQGETRPGIVSLLHWGCRPGEYFDMWSDWVWEEIHRRNREDDDGFSHHRLTADRPWNLPTPLPTA